MYQIRLANLADKGNILKLIKESLYRQCYRYAPANGYSDDMFLENIHKEIERTKDINGLYVVENEEKEAVAACSFYFTFHRNGYTFVRFYVKESIGEAAGFEIFKKVLNLCFLYLNYNKLNIELKSSQLKYGEIFRKSGFVKELYFREHFYHAGKYEDIIQLGLTREDFINKITCEEPYGEENITWDEDYLLKPDLQPSKQLLYGNKVDLTALRNEDARTIYEASKDSDYMQFASLSAPGPAHIQEANELIESENDYMNFQKGIVFAIRNKEGQVVGAIGSSMIDRRNRNLMISLEIFNSKERGRGYGSEAIRLFTDYAFLEMNMHRVYLGCFEFNNHAKYLYERLGFQSEGVNRAFVYRNGNYYNETSFGVVKKDWLTLRGYLNT